MPGRVRIVLRAKCKCWAWGALGLARKSRCHGISICRLQERALSSDEHKAFLNSDGQKMCRKLGHSFAGFREVTGPP